MDKMLGNNPVDKLSHQVVDSLSQMKQQPIRMPEMPQPLVKDNLPKSDASILLAIDGQQYGPFTKAEVLEQIRRGEITTETLMWRSGMLEWTPIIKVPGII